MYYNTFRSTSKDNLRRSEGNFSKSVDVREKLINHQKREKLKNLLITKFMKKYGIKNPEKQLEQEISKFLQGEKLTDADLKRLDEKLRLLVGENTSSDVLNILKSSSNPRNSLEIQTSGEKLILPEINDAASVRSKVSKMSGASNLSKFNEHGAISSKEKKRLEEEDFDCLSISSPKEPLTRIDFSNEGDEWNAICMYNQKLFQEEKLQNRIKDKEIKRRTKDDLDNQIRQKLKRMNEENIKSQEYDQVMCTHTEFLNQLEYQKQLDHKNKIQQEKENRDKQLQDEKRRKKIEVVKEKRYEKQLVNHLLEEIEKEKNSTLKRKQEEREALQKTLKSNELNKIKQLEQLNKEREDDVKVTQEYTKVLERQENERIEYFKRIERNGNNFMDKMVETVIKDMKDKNTEEDEKMRKWLEDKERRSKEEDERKAKCLKEGKQMMRNYLDMQVDEKRKMHHFENTLDSEQAKIWKIDTQRFAEQEKDINEKVRFQNTVNSHYLKDQIDLRRSKKQNYGKMSDVEYALNRNKLENLRASV